MDKHGYDAKTGLYYHAWDETRSRPWANKQTGQSPNFWGRAVGWYAWRSWTHSISFPRRIRRSSTSTRSCARSPTASCAGRIPKTGLWWQVLDQGDRKGNYLEATASSMFVYTLAKGINRGYLPREKYLPALLKGYEGILRDFIRHNPDNSISLTRCCQVAGLDYTNAQGPAARRLVRLLRRRTHRGQRPEGRPGLHPRGH
jgi:unsaturated rhamnogalacturonyl hydrolase